jgi:hypothetical protein
MNENDWGPELLKALNSFLLDFVLADGAIPLQPDAIPAKFARSGTG